MINSYTVIGAGNLPAVVVCDKIVVTDTGDLVFELDRAVVKIYAQGHWKEVSKR